MIVAIGLHADGSKEVLDFEPGASESAEVCLLLLERLAQRGGHPAAIPASAPAGMAAE